MEPEEKIVNCWLQISHKCLTMTNIPCEDRKEIDLLAYNPSNGDILHIEVSCPTNPSNWITFKDNQRFGIKSYNDNKFEHPAIKKKIKEIFGDKEIIKVLVCYGIDSGGTSEEDTVRYAYRKYGIVLTKIIDIVERLREEINVIGSRDEIIRFIELTSHSEDLERKSQEDFTNEIRGSLGFRPIRITKDGFPTPVE